MLDEDPCPEPIEALVDIGELEVPGDLVNKLEEAEEVPCPIVDAPEPKDDPVGIAEQAVPHDLANELEEEEEVPSPKPDEVQEALEEHPVPEHPLVLLVVRQLVEVEPRQSSRA